MTVDKASQRLIRQLSTIANLTDESKKLLADMPKQVVDFGQGEKIAWDGDRPTKSFIIVDGFAVSSKTTTEGNRQILAYFMPGDVPDLQSLHLPALDVTVSTIRPCKVAFVQHTVLQEICERHPAIAKVLWRWTLIAGSIHREWVTSVGRRRSSARIAHLMCEVISRMRALGLAQGNSCEMAMTQLELADATGMSAVHVNRSVQALRRANLITLRGTTLTVLDWEGLKSFGEFDPAYLHLLAPSAEAQGS